MRLMSEKQEKKPLHPETFFLPPLKMVLTFFEKESHQNEQDAKAEKWVASRQSRPSTVDTRCWT